MLGVVCSRWDRYLIALFYSCGRTLLLLSFLRRCCVAMTTDEIYAVEPVIALSCAAARVLPVLCITSRILSNLSRLICCVLLLACQCGY